MMRQKTEVFSDETEDRSVMMRQKTEVFSDDETEDRSRWKNSEVYRDILSAQIQSHAAKLIQRRFIVQMNNDTKHTAKATQKFLKVKSGLLCNGRVNLLISTRLSSISLTEDQTKDRKSHKQTTTKVSCSKDLGNIRKKKPSLW